MLHSRSLRLVAALGALAASIVLCGRAQAQASGTPQPFVTDDFFIAINGPDGSRLTPTDVSHFFNLARCTCQTPVGIYVALLQSGIAKRAEITASNGTVSIVLGAGCNTSTAVANGTALGTCQTLTAESAVTFLAQAQLTFQTDAQQLSVPYGSSGVDGGVNGTCVSPNGGQFTQTINVNFDFNGDGVIDFSVPNQVIIDLVPPPPPTGVTVQPGSQALVVDWTAIDTTVTTDLLGYQILCSRADQYQVFKETATDGGGAIGPFTAAFVTCPAAMYGSGVEGLDPTFVCSPLLGTGATSARIEILQNGITYAAAVVAIDQSGNPSESAAAFGTPIKTLSFYDNYREGTPPGGATGGLCAVGPSRPSLAQTWGALSLCAGLGAVLTGRRRRRNNRSRSQGPN